MAYRLSPYVRACNLFIPEAVAYADRILKRDDPAMAKLIGTKKFWSEAQLDRDQELSAAVAKWNMLFHERMDYLTSKAGLRCVTTSSHR